MSVLGLMTTAEHAVRVLRSSAQHLRTLLGKAAEIQTSEHSARALRKLSTDLGGLGLTAEAKLTKDIAVALEQLAIDLSAAQSRASLLETTANAIEIALRKSIAAPPDETPPDGLYLEKLSAALGTEYEWITPALSRWLVDHMRALRSTVRALLGPAEIAGDVDLVARAQKLLDEVNQGPSIQHGR